MNKRDAVVAKYNDVVACFAALQSAFTMFQQQPDAATTIKTLEDEKHQLLNAIIEFDQALFDFHYSQLMQGTAWDNLEAGRGSSQGDGDTPAD
jgi:hypothetical protein